jgi:chromosome segregation ATPase
MADKQWTDIALVNDAQWRAALTGRFVEAAGVGSLAVPVEIDQLKALLRLADDADFMLRLVRDRVEALEDELSARRANEQAALVRAAEHRHRTEDLQAAQSALAAVTDERDSAQRELAQLRAGAAMEARSWRDEADKLRRVGTALADKVVNVMGRVGEAIPSSRETALYREIDDAIHAWLVASGVTRR